MYRNTSGQDWWCNPVHFAEIVNILYLYAISVIQKDFVITLPVTFTLVRYASILLVLTFAKMIMDKEQSNIHCLQCPHS